jgi:hypothetical protein
LQTDSINRPPVAGEATRAFPAEEVQLLFLRCMESLLENVRQCCR